MNRQQVEIVLAETERIARTNSNADLNRILNEPLKHCENCDKPEYEVTLLWQNEDNLYLCRDCVKALNAEIAAGKYPAKEVTT